MNKTKFFLIAFASILALTSFVVAHTGDETTSGCEFGGMGSMMFGNFGFVGMFFGWVFGLLVLAILVLLVAWLIKQIQKK